MPGAQLTVKKYLTDWLEKTAKPKLKPSTYRSYEGLVRVHIEPALGRHPLAKLTPAHVRDFFNAKAAAGSSPRRIQMMRDVLRAALNEAQDWELVTRNVAKMAKPPRVNSAEMQPLTPEQAAKFLEAAKGSKYEHLLMLLLATGLRLGEALALRWKLDVDLDQRTLTVRNTLEWMPNQHWRLAEPKAKSARRTIPLIPAAIASLRAQHDRQVFQRRTVAELWQDHDLVFTNELGEPVRQRSVHKAFKDLLVKAELPATHRPHDLRHSTATYLLAAEVPTRVVQDILGHSTLAMTARYSHVLNPMLLDATKRLDRVFGTIAVQ